MLRAKTLPLLWNLMLIFLIVYQKLKMGLFLLKYEYLHSFLQMSMNCYYTLFELKIYILN
jgi:hypothetical protein